MNDPQTADHTAPPAAPERSPLWETVGDDVLILHPDTNVVHHLTGDAATAAAAVLRSEAVPSHLTHIADDLVDSGIVPTPTEPADPAGFTRRRFLTRAGAAAAIAGVTTLALPTAAAAASATNAVANLTSSAITDTGVTLTWDAFTGATSYTVEYTLTSAINWQPIGTPPTTSNTTYNVTGLTADTSYNFRVVADLTGGGMSDPSNTVTVLTQPAAPSNVTATPASLTSVTVTWN